MQKIVEHQSEFPVKLRQVIQRAAATAATAANSRHRHRVFHRTVYDALVSLLLCIPPGRPSGDANAKAKSSYISDSIATGKIVVDYETLGHAVASAEARGWVGFDSSSAFDTHDQVEVAVRAYPGVLGACLVIREEARRIWPIRWATYSRKAISFVPLLAELTFELNDGWYVRQIRDYIPIQNVTMRINPLVLHKEEDEDENDWTNQLADDYLSIAVRLKDKGLLCNSDFSHLVSSLYLNELCLYSVRGNQRFRYLLNREAPAFEEFLLKKFFDGLQINDIGSTRRYAYNANVDVSDSDDFDVKLERFRILFEEGMTHHPEEFGFLFQSEQNCSRRFGMDGPLFDIACHYFGTEKATKVVEEVLWTAHMNRTSTATTLVEGGQQVRNDDILRNLLLAMATNDIELNGLYFFCRRHPAVLFR